MLPVDLSLRGKIILALMNEARTVDQIAEEIDVKPEIVLANVVRMHHLGQVMPIAYMSVGMVRATRMRTMIWDLTVHSREHSSMEPKCWACRLRDRYLCASEAILE